MWPSFDIRIFQDASWFEIIYWILSPISVIAASAVAVFLTKSRDWKEDKKKIGYFSDTILFLYVRFDTFVKSIKLHPDSLSMDEALQDLFISCKKTAQDLDTNLVEVAKYCPTIGVVKDLLHLNYQFDTLEKCLTNSDKPQKSDRQRRIFELCDSIMVTVSNVADYYSPKKNWILNKFGKEQSIGEFIKKDMAKN